VELFIWMVSVLCDGNNTVTVRDFFFGMNP
jgi:hypothetical protein